MTDTHIKIGDVSPRTQYAADGATVEFVYPFPIFTAADLDVYLDAEAQVTGFTVVGAGASAGGSVVFDTEPASGVLVTLVRSIVIERTSDYQTNGAYRAQDINSDLDKLTAVAQELAYSNSLKIGVSPVEGEAQAALPSAAERANKFLGFGSSGEPVAAEVGLSQTVPPQFITLDSGQTDYPLTLPAGETVAASDLLIDINGWDIHSNTDYTVLNGSIVHLLIDMTEKDGYEMQVRIISGAGIFGQVADGAVNDPAKFAGRPVDNTVLAAGTPLGALGYDASGLPVVITRKYVGEAWTWDGAAENLPAGNILLTGQTLSATTFPELFGVYGYRHGGSGDAFKLPNPAARMEIYAGQGLTAEGGGIGTARLAGATGGKENHTQLPGEVGQHTHPAQPGGAGSTGGVVNGTESQKLIATAAATSPNAGPPTAMPIMPPWFCAGYRAVHTGRIDHDYLGNIL